MAAKIPQADREVFLEELARYQKDTIGSVVTASANAFRLMVPRHIWRQRVCDLVQGIIDPEPLTWMDDDDGAHIGELAFIRDLCCRSLDEIQLRFEQSVILIFVWMQDLHVS